MASARRIAANRRNARRSTGPKTATGRARASRNACRHGLRGTSCGTSGTAEWTGEVERLAHAIAGGSNAPMIVTWARTAAQAGYDIERVRLARTAIIADIERTLAASTGALDMEALARTAARLNILNRYERRAAGRRDRAIRALCRYRAASASSTRRASTNEANLRKDVPSERAQDANTVAPPRESARTKPTAVGQSIARRCARRPLGQPRGRPPPVWCRRMGGQAGGAAIATCTNRPNADWASTRVAHTKRGEPGHRARPPPFVSVIRRMFEINAAPSQTLMHRA